jgi:hypothetical protein
MHEFAALSHAVDAPFDIAAFGEERQPCAAGSRESGINRVPPDKGFRCLVPTVQVIAPATKRSSDLRPRAIALPR